MPRPRTPTNPPIELDLTAAFDHERGVGRADLLQLASQLEQARQTLIDEASQDAAHWLNWPRRLLEDHEANRHRGLLTHWLTAAKQFRHRVDRVVILGSPGSIAVLEAIFAACCHPYHNELPRGERGGRPRIYFVSTKSDNDVQQGLFDLLPQQRQLHSEEDRWGVVAIDDGCDSNLLTAVFQVYWDALLATTEPGAEAERAMTIGPPGSPLLAFAEQASCRRLPYFTPLPLAAEAQQVETMNSSAHPYHPGILLAAAVMNIDVVQFLCGAVVVTDRFRTAPPGNNPSLDFAGFRHLLAERRGIQSYAIDCPTALRPLAAWWQAATATSEAGEHLLIQWLSGSVRRDRLRVTMPAGEAPSGRKKMIERYLPDVATATADAVRTERTARGLPTAVVRLPTVDEATVGQLLQLQMIAHHCALHAPS